MKKVSIIIIMLTLIMGIHSCDMEGSSQLTKNGLPAHFQELGEAFALKIRQTAANLSKLPLDYSNITNVNALKKRFYKDYLTAHSAMQKSENITEMQKLISNQEVMSARSNNLTTIQLNYIKKILIAADNSISCEDFLDRLLKINQDIQIEVPHIEQERLFLITTYLYYGFQEIYTLERNGLMPLFNKNDIATKMPDEGWIDGKWCRKILSTAWTIALLEPTPIGEVIASVGTIIIEGMFFYEYIICKVMNPDDVVDSNIGTYDLCQEYYKDCTDYTPYMDCGTCLQNCLVQGFWPEEMCTRYGGNQQ